jgi:tetratricopeptide (TPR) repeat protein
MLVLLGLVLCGAPARGEERVLSRPVREYLELQRYIELGKHIELGLFYFQNGQFDQAAETWAAAYLFKPVPDLLRSLGDAHRMAGRARVALLMYERYLQEQPRSPLRAETERHIAALRRTLSLGPALGTDAAYIEVRERVLAREKLLPGPPLARALPPDPVPLRARPRLHLKPWLWTTLAVVTAAVGTGIAAAVLARRPDGQESSDLGTDRPDF